MTIQELKNYLVKHSPFRTKGYDDELFYFTESTIRIQDGEPFGYVLSGDGNFFTLQETPVKGLFPFFINYQIVDSEIEESPITINYDESKIKQDPYRDANAINGFLILEPAQGQ